MAFNLEEILKQAGYTDADIEANKTLLSDAKFRDALSTQYGALETDLTKYKAENDGWAKWHDEHAKPTLEAYERDKADALAEAASLRERLKLAEEAGYAPRRDPNANPNPNPNPAANPNPVPFDPKAHKLVTQDDVAKFAEMEGRAIAMTNDLYEEYRQLTGKSLLDYTATFDGRTLRGMSALRQESVQSRVPLDQYVSKKFDFDGHRHRISEENRKKAEDAIRADERQKVISQFGHPEQRPLVPSRDPFIPRAAGEGDNAKHPWEMNAQERRAQRLDRAMQNQMKGAVQ